MPGRWRVSGARGDWCIEGGDGTVHRLTALDAREPGRLRACIDGRDVVAAVTRRGNRCWLQADGHELLAIDERFTAARPPSYDAHGVLHAPMHGRLLRVPEAGSIVAKGDVLAVIEAMKIEHPLAAPAAGTVRAVHARVGDQVAARALLVEIEPAS